MTSKLIRLAGCCLLLFAAVQLAADTSVSLSSSASFSFNNSGLPYRESLDHTSTATAAVALSLPATMMFENKEARWRVPVFYAAALGSSHLVKEALKDAFGHPRPDDYRRYYAGTEEDLYRSFPSGHTTMSVTAAVFTTVLYSRKFPDSRLRIPVTASVSVSAAATGGLRIVSGSHHPKDVVAGFVLGALIGSAFAMAY
ncbi:MAG: phosphatase PAP2 family protein [Spirochaetota bacterium]